MSNDQQGIARRMWEGFLHLLPSGPADDDGPPPDVDGRRDSDTSYQRGVLHAKSQMSSGGQATTSYEPVERGRLNDD